MNWGYRMNDYMSDDQKGFTLIELMVVVAIVAILTMVALPFYEEYVIRSNRSVGAAELMKLASRQEQFFIDNKTYAVTLGSLGYINTRIDREGQQVATGGIYSLSLDSGLGSSGSVYLLKAAPQGKVQVKDDCGTLTLNHLGQRGDDGGSRCWE